MQRQKPLDRQGSGVEQLEIGQVMELPLLSGAKPTTYAATSIWNSVLWYLVFPQQSHKRQAILLLPCCTCNCGEAGADFRRRRRRVQKPTGRL